MKALFRRNLPSTGPDFVVRFVEYAMNASNDTVTTGGNTIDDLARLVRLP
jgi:hypothetical protein